MKKLKSVLLVDDDDITNFVNEDLIKGLNVTEQVHIAKNGKQALSFICDNCFTHAKITRCPELVLLDISMPVMDGFEFLEEFKKLNGSQQNISIVMLTSSDSERDIEKSRSYGVSGYIGKPLTEEKLMQVLN